MISREAVPASIQVSLVSAMMYCKCPRKVSIIRRVAVFTVALSAVPFDLYCTDHMIEKSLSPDCKLVGSGSQQPATSRTSQYHHSILRFTLFILGVILRPFRPPLRPKVTQDSETGIGRDPKTLVTQSQYPPGHQVQLASRLSQCWNAPRGACLCDS